MQAFTLITLEAFFYTNNTNVEVLLILNLFVLYEGNTQTAGRNIHHQHTFTVTGNLAFFQSIADGNILGVNFARHIYNINYQTSFAIDLVKQKDLVASFTNSSGSLHLVLFHAVFFHQRFETLQDFTNLVHKTKGYSLILKSFFTKTHAFGTTFNNFISINTAVFGYLHTNHL